MVSSSPLIFLRFFPAGFRKCIPGPSRNFFTMVCTVLLEICSIEAVFLIEIPLVTSSTARRLTSSSDVIKQRFPKKCWLFYYFCFIQFIMIEERLSHMYVHYECEGKKKQETKNMCVNIKMCLLLKQMYFCRSRTLAYCAPS